MTQLVSCDNITIIIIIIIIIKIIILLILVKKKLVRQSTKVDKLALIGD